MPGHLEDDVKAYLPLFLSKAIITEDVTAECLRIDGRVLRSIVDDNLY